MSSWRLSAARPTELSLLLDQGGHRGLSSQASASPVVTPKDQGRATDDIPNCISVDGRSSGINRSGLSSDNPAVVSKCRTPSALQTATLGVKGAGSSKSHLAVSGKPKRGEGSNGNEIACKQNPECSMCGDVGLRKQLVRCGKCQYRFQHTYCSNWYPKKRSYAGICNWCDMKDEERRKQTKQTENDCATSQAKIQTAEDVEIARKKQRNLLNRSRKGDIRPKMRNPWKNELEMLLDAAKATGEAGMESNSGNEVAKVTELMRCSNSQTDQRSDKAKVEGRNCIELMESKSGNEVAKVTELMRCSNSQTDQLSDKAKVDGRNCKGPSSLAKKIGRRYKFIVDVY